MSEQNVPFFSVVICVYNQKELIKRSIESVINQSFKDVEVIVVNDCSTDDTSTVVNEYTVSNSNVRLINHEENTNLHLARMTGFLSAKGKYTMSLDSDDYMMPNALEILYRYISNDTVNKIFEFGYRLQPSEEDVIFEQDTRTRFDALITNEKRLNQTIWNKVYESSILKQAFNKMSKFESLVGEDYYEQIVIADLWRFPYKNIPEVLYNYMFGDGVSTRKKTARQNLLRCQKLKDIYFYTISYLEDNNLYSKEVDKIIRKKCYHDSISFARYFSINKRNEFLSICLFTKFFPEAYVTLLKDYTFLRVVYKFFKMLIK